MSHQPPQPAAGPVAAETGNYKVGEPYQINGIWYYPHEDYDYRENGVASWYGADFHGKRTANGEIYDMNAMTAAHRTLPMPSLVRVTNQTNGRTLVVRVNDRGPFANDRILDLSRRSAQLLGFEEAGTTRVKVEILTEESIALKSQLLRNNLAGAPRVDSVPRAIVASETLPPLPVTSEALPPVAAARSPAPPPKAKVATPAAAPTPAKAPAKAAPPATPPAGVEKPGVFVQAASFANEDFARRLGTQLKSYGPTSLLPLDMGDRRMWRVRLGPWVRQKDAEQALDKVRKAGFRDARLVVVD
ncbi:MAG: septal ring lytic transglycosylase RlpA family protein [Alphaproteobacteria bacterium]